MKRSIKILLVLSGFVFGAMFLSAYEPPTYDLGGKSCKCKQCKCITSSSIFRKNCGSSTPFAPCSTRSGCVL